MGNGEINIKIGPGIICSPLAEGCGTLGSVWKTITIRRTEEGGEVMGGAPRANIQTMGYIHHPVPSRHRHGGRRRIGQSWSGSCLLLWRSQDSILSVNGMCLRQWMFQKQSELGVSVTRSITLSSGSVPTRSRVCLCSISSVSTP